MLLFDLFGFQAEDVQKLKSKRARLIGNDPGTGKTYEGIALDQLNRQGDGNSKIDTTEYPVKKTLIVCPKSVLSVWDEHCMDLTEEDVYVIDAKNRKKFVQDALNRKKDGYFICNWDALRLMPELEKVVWFHIIADEVHRAKNRKAQSTRALKKLRTVYKTAMSGTPADDKPQDIWSILNWLWPNYYTSFWNFVKAYCKMEVDEETGYRKFVGLIEENLPHLQQQMAPWFTRRRKEDVLTDLPDKYYTRVWVDLSPKQRKAYDQMRKTMTAWAEQYKEELEREDPIIAQAAITQLVRLQQYACGYVIPRLNDQDEHIFKWKWPKNTSKEMKAQFADNPEEFGAKKVYQYDVIDPSTKIDAIIELLEDRPDEQFVVFSQFKSVVNLLAARLEKKGVSHGLLTGDVGQQDRARHIHDFQQGKTRVFAGTIQAGGVGITLTSASTVVFIDRWWSPSINRQAEDRCHRIGQTEAVEIIDIMARNTVDLGKHQKIAAKWKLLQMLLGDTVEPDRVMAMMQEEKGLDVAADIAEAEE